MKEILVNSDIFRDSHSLILAPDNAWEIGKAIVDNTAKGYYPRARAAAMKAGSIILGETKFKMTAFEKAAVEDAMKQMEALPADEGTFVDMCLKKYTKLVPGFNPDSYGLK
jgi:methanol--5-hydroxybenzimidazolylcobamide Co-methyltransferase